MELFNMEEKKIEIQNGEAAYLNVADFLRDKGHTLLQTFEINYGRYRILKTDRETFLVLFKRDLFHNFSKYFREQGATGMGETINSENLKEGILKGAMKILFIYPNCHIYSISVSDFLKDSFKRINKENKETRSISIHLLRRENPEIERLK